MKLLSRLSGLRMTKSELFWCLTITIQHTKNSFHLPWWCSQLEFRHILISFSSHSTDAEFSVGWGRNICLQIQHECPYPALFVFQHYIYSRNGQRSQQNAIQRWPRWGKICSWRLCAERNLSGQQHELQIHWEIGAHLDSCQFGTYMQSLVRTFVRAADARSGSLIIVVFLKDFKILVPLTNSTRGTLLLGLFGRSTSFWWIVLLLHAIRKYMH